ncbi:hypothetical protein BDU57DRAFT_345685 [Ampelomyces quisqualis]|uniref:F-box domain-containing protein n=1 Tax=Ampelomyces quisqualis TaxID=50730 RepID=A0A6A5QCP4_AMPQU|nr:hypothetical protein BDU57DRAFT_345685 [Ampelomyces quisqualis]
MAQTRKERAITRVQQDDDDVIITKETYKGKELVIVDKPVAPYIRDGLFPFMDLPAELRVHIYSFLVPYSMVIQHALTFKDNEEHWHVWATPKLDIVQHPSSIPSKRAFRNRLKVASQLFHVSKAVSNDALGVLYGSNTYKFTVNGQAHYPKSMQSPQIFGHFSDYENGLERLRDLRSIRIEVLLDVRYYWAAKRQRARLEYFVNVLKEFADDGDKKSLLQELQVDFVLPQRDDLPLLAGKADTLDAGKFIFGLESLAALKGISNVVISGVPEWYAQCLTLCIQGKGKGGHVKNLEWPEVEVKKKKKKKPNSYKSGSDRPYRSWVSTRKWWQPLLDWKEFAERNGIKLPENIEEYWEVVDKKLLAEQ